MVCLIAYKIFTCQQKYASELKYYFFEEQKLTFLVNITGTSEALIREHISRVCRCIYIQHVHAQILPWLGHIY